MAAAFRSLAVEAPIPPSDDLIARVRAGPVAPAVFAIYTELVEAILADELGRATAIAGELCAPNFGRIGGLRMATLDDRDLGAGQAARYRRLADEDPALGAALRALTPDELAAGVHWVRKAILLLEAAAPEVAGEFKVLMHEIVLVDRPDMTFSAASFHLWGALFLKINPDTNRVEVAEALAHETAHAFLFGLSMGKPLVKNEAEELYINPMRGDQRPMDSVVHATYVIARMHYAVNRLLASGLLTDEEQQAARDARKRHEQYFDKGIAAIEANAKWSPEGEAAFASAHAYMRSAH